MNALPDTFTGELTVVLNDRDPFVSLRNIMLLRLLGAEGDPRRAVDAALHYWYSVLLPGQYHVEILSVLLDIRMKASERSSSQDHNYDLGARSSLRFLVDADSDLCWIIPAFLRAPEIYDSEDAKKELARVR